MIKILRYRRDDGHEPFTEWLNGMRGKSAQARVRVRLRRLEAGMNTQELKGVASHHEAEIAELAADRELAVEYLKAAMESLDDPDNRAAGLLALRTVAEAYGGLAAVASRAGISRESLYRALSPKGNPTLKTLLAVLNTVGLRLSVETEDHAPV